MRRFLFLMVLAAGLMACLPYQGVCGIVWQKGNEIVLISEDGMIQRIPPPAGRQLITADYSPDHHWVLATYRDIEAYPQGVADSILSPYYRFKLRNYETVLYDSTGHFNKSLWKTKLYHQAWWPARSDKVLVFSQIDPNKPLLITIPPEDASFERFKVFNRTFSIKYPGSLYALNPLDGKKTFLSGTTGFIQPYTIQSHPDYVSVGLRNSREILALAIDSASPGYDPFSWPEGDELLKIQTTLKIDYEGKRLESFPMRNLQAAWAKYDFIPVIIRQSWLNKPVWWEIKENTETQDHYLLRQWDAALNKPDDIISLKKGEKDVSSSPEYFELSRNGRYVYVSPGFVADLTEKSNLQIPLPADSQFLEFHRFSPDSQYVYYSINWNNERYFYQWKMGDAKTSPEYLWKENRGLLYNKMLHLLKTLF